MNERRIDVFFYGLFMDAAILREAGVAPANPRCACVADYALRIGQRATLVPSSGALAYGVLYALAHSDLERLYRAPGLELYRPEAVLAVPLGGSAVPALCYNLREAPPADERNPQYALRLQAVLRSLGFPDDYVAALTTS